MFCLETKSVKVCLCLLWLLRFSDELTIINCRRRKLPLILPKIPKMISKIMSKIIWTHCGGLRRSRWNYVRHFEKEEGDVLGNVSVTRTYIFCGWFSSRTMDFRWSLFSLKSRTSPFFFSKCGTWFHLDRGSLLQWVQVSFDIIFDIILAVFSV